tara:strand:- start:493 stop:1149 length:657 start_codon:yes stop_codon:yes gene_type:complete
MAWGMKVLNADNRVILNTTDNLSTLIRTASGAVTGTNFAYPSGTSNADLFLVHLPAAGFVAQNATFSGSSDTIYSSYSSAKNWIKASATNSTTVSGYSSGYGIKIMNAAGDDVTFSSETGDALEIVAVGTYGDLGNSTSLSYTINSTTPHYVLIPGSAYNYFSFWSFTGTFKMGYQFNYSGSTCTSIEIHRSFLWGSGSIITGSSQGASTYMIVKYRS